MRGSARNFKSHWDMKEERQPPAEIHDTNACSGIEHHSSSHGGHRPKWSDLEVSNASKSVDRSRWPSREPSQGNSDVHKDDIINIDRKRSPAFDQRGCKNNSRSPDDSWSLSHRGRGRSRSRSRSRSSGSDRGRSTSRSRSRGRARDWIRSRSRSRSRSPFHDHRRGSYGRIDRRRSGGGISSQPCRYFAVGKCNKGSQCKFFHQDNLNSRDDRSSENDPAKRWRSRPEHGGVVKFGDNGKDEPLKDSSKDTIYCKDFLKGRCQRGSSCRYPHHGENYDRGNRNASSYDRDHNFQPNRSGKAPCKYFLMGKCHMDDCRFSHDGPTSENFDGRSRDDRWAHNLEEKRKSWNGPTWDDVEGFSNTAKPTGWGDGSVGNTNFHDPMSAEKGNDDRWVHNLDEKRKSWNRPTWDDAEGFSDTAKPAGWVDGSVGNTGFHDPMAAEKQNNDRRAHNLDEKRKSWNGPTWDDVEGFSDTAKPAGWVDGSVGNIDFHDPMAAEKGTDDRQAHNLDEKRKSWNDPTCGDATDLSDIGKSTGWGDNIAITDDFNALNEGKVSVNIIDPVLLPEQSFNQNDDSVVSKPPLSLGGTDQNHSLLSVNIIDPVLLPEQSFNQNDDSVVSQPPSSLGGTDQIHSLLSVNPSNGHIDLNDSVQHILSPPHAQDHTQIHHEEAIKSSEMMEFRVPQVTPQICQNVVTSEQVAQMTNLPPSLSCISQNGQLLPQLYAALNPPNATGLMDYFPSSASVLPPIDSMVVQLNQPTRSQEECDPIRDNNEQENQRPLERLSPLSTGNTNSSKLEESGKVSGNIESKQKQENIHSGSVDAHGKVEESNISKDEKAMRLFKIALVEFVKEILKPKWKEGQMSREVHKTIVKKVVDKVTSTIQGDQIPRTQDKIDQYLSFSKAKISKLVQAYVERFLKGVS